MEQKISKTKQRLIETARTLFAEKGKKNITMNDIAQASMRGRRTLYTYFRSKNDIYRAVINNELNFVLSRIQQVFKLHLEPDVKLTKHIIAHLDAVKEAVERNGSLSADFFIDIYEVERARRSIDKQEHELLRIILKEGVNKALFKPVDPDLSATIILYAIKGLEVPYIRQNINEKFQHNKRGIIDFILTGIKRPMVIRD